MSPPPHGSDEDEENKSKPAKENTNNQQQQNESPMSPNSDVPEKRVLRRQQNQVKTSPIMMPTSPNQNKELRKLQVKNFSPKCIDMVSNYFFHCSFMAQGQKCLVFNRIRSPLHQENSKIEFAYNVASESRRICSCRVIIATVIITLVA